MQRGRGISEVAMAMATVMDGGVGWSPELEAKKREELRKNIESDPFFLIRQRMPKYERLSFIAEAERIRKKKSKWPKADRAYILSVVEEYERRKAKIKEQP